LSGTYIPGDTTVTFNFAGPGYSAHWGSDNGFLMITSGDPVSPGTDLNAFVADDNAETFGMVISVLGVPLPPPPDQFGCIGCDQFNLSFAGRITGRGAGKNGFCGVDGIFTARGNGGACGPLGPPRCGFGIDFPGEGTATLNVVPDPTMPGMLLVKKINFTL